MKKISKQMMKDMNGKMGYEGIHYYLSEYAPSDFKGTELQPLLEIYQKAEQTLLDRFKELTEEYNLQFCEDDEDEN